MIKEKIINFASWCLGIFFSLFGWLILLGSLFNTGIVRTSFGIIIIIFGLSITPYFSNLISNKTKFKIKTKHRFLAILVCFTLLFLMSTVVNSPPVVNQEMNINLEGKSAEEVLDIYLNHLSYNNLSDRINSLNFRTQLAEDYKKESLIIDEVYHIKLRRLNYDWIETCEQAGKLAGNNVCEKASEYGPFGKIYYKFELISKEFVENNDIVKIKIVYNATTGKSPEEIINQDGETTYFLKKYDSIWKIYDGLDDRGQLFSSVNLSTQKDNYDTNLKEQREILNPIKKLVSETEEKLKEVDRISNELFAAVKSSVSSTKEIKPLYNSETKGFTIYIEYFFQEEFLSDDYYVVKSDATKIFKNVFPISSTFHNVEVVTIQEVKDIYGNTQEKILAKSSMDRETFNKINWEGFESQNLDKVTSVNFFGDSFLKSLEDLRNDMETIKSGSSSIYGYDTGIPSSVCDDATQQCEKYEECDLINMMKSQGMC